MKFDMHCHTKEGSVDARVSIEDYIKTLREKGFDGMLVSDHDSYDGYRYWRKNIRGKEYKDFVPSLKVFEKYAEIFDKKIKDLDFSPEKAGILPYETCIQCHHKSICRYSYTVGMKNIKEGN